MSKWYRGALAALLAVSLIFTVVACGGVTKPTNGDTKTDDKEGGTLIWVLGNVFDYPDPHTCTTLSQGYYNRLISDTLVMMDREGMVQPLLAGSWDESDDRLTYTFYLQEGVTFHDGTPFNADAVIFTYGKIADHPIRPRPPEIIDQIVDMKALGDYTLEITLAAPNPQALEMFADNTLVMVSPTAWREMGDDFSYNPVGTGPFKFVSWKVDEVLELERYEDYWQGHPYLDGVRVVAIPSREVQALELEAGNGHIMVFVEAEGAARLDSLGFGVDTSAGLSHRHITMNNHRAPLDDIRVRRALIAASDRQEYIDINYLGRANELITGISPDSWGYCPEAADVDYMHHNPELADQLLVEAGWELADDGWRYSSAGERLTLDLICPSTPLRQVTKAEIFQEQMRRVGVEVIINQVERTVWRATWEDEPYYQGLLNMDGRGKGTLHPAGQAEEYHTDMFRNVIKHHIQELDEAIDRLVLAFERDEILEAAAEFQVLWVKHALTVPIYNPGYIMAWSPHFKGDWWRDSTGAFVQMHLAWLEPEGR